MGFQHAVLGTEVAGTEAAITDDALSGFLALLEVASRLAGRHCVEEGSGRISAQVRRWGVGEEMGGNRYQNWSNVGE